MAASAAGRPGVNRIVWLPPIPAPRSAGPPAPAEPAHAAPVMLHDPLPAALARREDWPARAQNLACVRCGLAFAHAPKPLPRELRADATFALLPNVACSWPCAVEELGDSMLLRELVAVMDGVRVRCFDRALPRGRAAAYGGDVDAKAWAKHHGRPVAGVPVAAPAAAPARRPYTAGRLALWLIGR
jgi:hypothetical protein